MAGPGAETGIGPSGTGIGACAKSVGELVARKSTTIAPTTFRKYDLDVTRI